MPIGKDKFDTANIKAGAIRTGLKKNIRTLLEDGQGYSIPEILKNLEIEKSHSFESAISVMMNDKRDKDTGETLLKEDGTMVRPAELVRTLEDDDQYYYWLKSLKEEKKTPKKTVKK